MSTGLRHLLQENRAVITERWRQLILDTYAQGTAQFLKSEKDPFANPVGGVVTKVVGPLLDHLIEGKSREEVAGLVDDIMRVRAVQAFTPSQAVAFYFLLKEVVREAIDVKSLDAPVLVELMAFETRVDQLALLAFETYQQCREKLYEIQATEIRSRSLRVLEKLNARYGDAVRNRSESDDHPPTPVGDGKRGGTR